MNFTLRGAAVLAAATLVGSVAAASTSWADGTRAACRYPAEVLDLTDWKMTLPIGEEEKPTEIKQPDLATYAVDPWFVPLADCSGVRFRAAVNGVTTSGSKYPRAELREMTGGGTENASWSSSEGTHTMVVNEAFTKLPNDKPHVVGAQIHDSEDDVTVFRLEGTQLWITDGDEPHGTLVTDDYQLGTPYEAKFVVHDGATDVYYNGTLVTTLTKDYSGAYFKTGAYAQANCENSEPCDEGNYGEVIIYDVTVTHGP